MLPLKFPNSGVRANVFVRKIGFKLRVMRLNRVESFYMFLLHFYSERSEEGWPPMATPAIGVRPRLLIRGWLDARRWSPVGAAVARGHDRLQSARRGSSLPWAQSLASRRPKGRPTIGHPQGATASRGDDASRRGGRPLARRQPTDKGNRRLCKGSDGDVVRVEG
ncbi:hypothetical protein BHE74_00003232 [Ensete ventricosum]|nr:hypothetical protein GW17_00041848 [Ensete ventricosum]RWW87913.1 hypothetical protein BHE74_00003232 [Ensete ventricosum]RZS10692.1 hypothetical protein BHM03_00041952 [Ensete ventricosum]